MVIRLKAFFIVMSAIVLISVGSPSSEAITINVDGNSGDWGTLAPLVSDPEEAGIPADYNLSNFYVTNDLTDMFFRLDVYGTPTLTGLNLFNSAFYQLYLDTDQNQATGTSFNGIGVDRIIDYRSSGVTVYDAAGTVVGSGNGAQGSGPAGATEISASLADLGLTTSINVNMFAYLDNVGSPPDDLAPDTIDAEYQMVQAIPEPDTMLLLGVGILGLSALGKKKLHRKPKKFSS